MKVLWVPSMERRLSVLNVLLRLGAFPEHVLEKRDVNEATAG
jgi:hypothetical protein